MAFFNEFPHTRTYDSDLAWLIQRMKEVLARMDSVEERMAALEQLVADFIANLNIEQAIKDALIIMVEEGVFNDLLTQLFSDYSQTINNRLDAQDLAIQNAVTNLTQRVDALANSLANYYTKTEIDNKLAGLGQLIDNLDATIVNTAGRARAEIEVSGGDLESYTFILGANDYLFGRFNINLSYSNGRSINEMSTRTGTIQRIKLFDEEWKNLTIPLSRFYDLCHNENRSDAVSIIYGGFGATNLPPYETGNVLGGCSFSINHKTTTGSDTYLCAFGFWNVQTTMLCVEGSIANVNGVYGKRTFPSNEEIRTLLT